MLFAWVQTEPLPIAIEKLPWLVVPANEPIATAESPWLIFPASAPIATANVP